MNRVCVIVLVQKNAGQALDALRALAASVTPFAFETIVLLNGAEEATVTALRRGAPHATILVSEANLGFGAGNNFAARRTRAEYLAFLNDDTIVDTKWLAALVACADEDESIAAVGSRIRFADGTLQEAGSLVWSDGSTAPVGRGASAYGNAWCFRRDVTYASACALLVRRADFERVGGFDEAFFPAYYEDVDLCLSLAAGGKRVVFEPAAELVHHESRSVTSSFKEHLFRRNHRRLVRKWATTLVRFPPPEPADPVAVENAIAAAWRKPYDVLLIDDLLPDASLGSGFGRPIELFADLVDSPYQVHIFASAKPDGDPRSIGRYGVRAVSRTLEAELGADGRRFDIAIVSRPHNYQFFAETIRKLQPGCAICFDVESLFHRRMEKQMLMERDPGVRRDLKIDFEDYRKREFEIARAVDRLVCISTDELAVLEAVPDHAPIDFILPVARNIALTEPEFEEREPLAILVAGWMAGATSPNADGLRWLVEHVVPLVRERVPFAKIAVTGAAPPPSFLGYASTSLEFVGYVADLPALYARARVALSPVRFGAGVKIKTIEAIQFGVPVVATSVGAEGIIVSEKAAMAVTDDPRAFADAIVALLSSPKVWRESREAAIAQTQAWLNMPTKNWRDVCDALHRPSRSIPDPISAAR